ncbi:nuclear pore complex protein NUP155-like isoform X1 [Zingiber officinale]|uniref:nuclear pore complex protein NUP155-like isoform X1 n=1 Tax=Zingiber officinale TaxID=94328 RepID=UPI001C4C1414|nr:nuclear pore complex protein NUP155-like isoform X1 [Zingiber officinale]
MSPSASAGTSPAASTSRRLSKPRSMLASPTPPSPKRYAWKCTTFQIILCEALSRGGVAEACSVVKRVGSNIYTGVEGRLSLEIIYLHLEMAASQCMNILQTGLIIRARALLAACKVEPKPVLSTYDQLLSYGAILPSPNLNLRCLRSVLVVLCEWVGPVFAHTLGTTAVGASPILGGLLLLLLVATRKT